MARELGWVEVKVVVAVVEDGRGGTCTEYAVVVVERVVDEVLD